MSRTANEITTEILNNMPDSYNRSTGSVLYDLQAPVGMELEALEATNDVILANAFFDTADDEHKEIIAKDRANIVRRAATKASGEVTISGEIGTAIPAGTQVASDFAIFDTLEGAVVGSDGTATVLVECEAEGTIGNVPAGAIYEFPVTISGLNVVTNEQAFSNGYEIESIDDFSERYHAAMTRSPGTGTEADYETWALEVEGVAAARCFGRTPTRGSVTMYIMNQNHRAADASLVEDVSDYIQTKRPTPANVIINSVSEVTIDVSVTVYVSHGSTSDYEAAITGAIFAYIHSIGYGRETRRVSAALIGDAVLSVDGVTDIDDLLLNDEPGSISLSDTEIAVLGGVAIAEG